ncbi:hypothetical protein BKA93DRAFT_824946 [Sparassis latifolia]
MSGPPEWLAVGIFRLVVSWLVSLPMSKRKCTGNPATREVLQLPRPGQTVVGDDELEVIGFEITSQTTIPILKEKLKGYGLPVSGNKDALLEWLREFAADKESWRGLLLQPRQMQQRGARTGERANTQSAKHIVEQFGDKAKAVVQYRSRCGVYR